MSDASIHDLKKLVQSFHSLILVEGLEEERIRSMLASTAADLRLPFFEWSVVRGFTRFPQNSEIDGTTEPLQAIRYVESFGDDAVFQFKDLGPHLSQPSTCRLLREVVDSFRSRRTTIVISGVSVELPAELSHQAVRLHLRLPGKKELREVIGAVLDSLRTRQKVSVDLNATEMGELLDALTGLTSNQARQSVARAVVEDGRLDASDLRSLLQRKGELLGDSGVLEYFPAGDNISDLGGFLLLKEWLARTKAGFTAEAKKMNLPAPKGVLFVGVQGCGKSLAAKFIAREWRLPLLKLDAGRLYDKFIGESEKNLRRAFQMAEAMAPAVLWIDEIEKLFASAGSSDSDGGLSRRIFGSFLTWMQEKTAPVFVVGAANDLSLLPPELLRKGRFDEIFFVDLPTEEERTAIFRIHLKLRNQPVDRFDVNLIAGSTEGFSGAEIEQTVIAALYRSIHEKAALTSEGLLQSASQTIPLSVTRREDVERLRTASRGRFHPVS